MSAQHPSGKNPSRDGARFQELEALLADRSAARRAQAVRQLAVEISSELSEAERGMLEAWLKRAANDAELVVRTALAGSLRRSRYLPHDIALMLADDALNVAQPILEESPVLGDGDLKTILLECNGRKQICIARRASVSADLARAVVSCGNAAAVAALAGNGSASLDEALVCAILDRYGRFETVRAAIVARGELAPSVCERLQRLAGGRPQSAIEEIATEEVPGPVRANAAKLHASGALTAEAVLQALCGGDIRFTEDAMAEFAGVSAEKASLLIHDASPFGLKAIYRQCGFPEQLFTAFRVAIDMVQEREFDAEPCGDEAFTARVIERILAKYRELEVGDLDYVLAKLGKREAA